MWWNLHQRDSSDRRCPTPAQTYVRIREDRQILDVYARWRLVVCVTPGTVYYDVYQRAAAFRERSDARDIQTSRIPDASCLWAIRPGEDVLKTPGFDFFLRRPGRAHGGNKRGRAMRFNG